MSARKILIYVEPHPLRNTLMEFSQAAEFFSKSFSLIQSEDLDWRLFSNRQVLSELAKSPEYQLKLIAPTDDEQRYFEGHLREWSDIEIAERNNLVRGDGEISKFYIAVLTRIWEVFEADAIFLWSENGAVRTFGKNRGISVYHVELGSTRFPFPQTFYIDPQGTNGFSTSCDFDLKDYPAEKVVAADTWLTLASAASSDVALIEKLYNINIDFLGAGQQGKYIVVALQLADDLNTLLHSDFASPLEFLQYILPPLIDRGFTVVIKGHPGVATRPTNLQKEIVAVNYAKNFGSAVKIIDRHCPSDEFLLYLRDAAAVCSINSSVSFEALLVGTPGVVFGKAVYDIDGKLRKAGHSLLETGVVTIEQPHVDNILSVLFRHYFHTFTPQVASDVFLSICSRNVRSGDAGFMKWLVDNIDHGTELIDAERLEGETMTSIRELAEAAMPLQGELLGFVEKFELSYEAGYAVCRLTGWVAWPGKSGAIAAVGLMLGSTGYLHHTKMYHRPDVEEVFPDLRHDTGFEFDLRLPSSTSPDDIMLIFVASDRAFKHEARLSSLAQMVATSEIEPSPPIEELQAISDRATEDCPGTLSVDSTFIGFVEKFEVEYSRATRVCTLGGWVARQGSAREQVTAVGLIADDVLGMCELHERIDVKMHSSDLAEKVGFQFKVILPTGFSPEALRIVFFTPSAEYSHFAIDRIIADQATLGVNESCVHCA